MPNHNKRLLIICLILISCFLFGGCSLLTLPIKATQLAFDVIGKAFELAEKMPSPPPGVF